MSAPNVFSDLPQDMPDEVIEPLLRNRVVRIERIVSRGHASPENFWYDQDTNEWVMVLKGRARLVMEGETSPLDLGPGCYINIPAHRRHRVEWTDPDDHTIWLTVHYRTEPQHEGSL